MSLHLIAGNSGSGKSSVGRVLAARGFEVIEADADSALSGYVNNRTGERVREVPPYPHPAEWVQAHSWRWSGARLREIARRARSRPAFLCGGAFGMEEFHGVFDMRFLIWADARTTALRLQAREPERWRDGSPELQRVLKANDDIRRWGIQHGFTILVGNQTPEAIAGDILAYLEAAARRG